MLHSLWVWFRGLLVSGVLFSFSVVVVRALLVLALRPCSFVRWLCCVSSVGSFVGSWSFLWCLSVVVLVCVCVYCWGLGWGLALSLASLGSCAYTVISRQSLCHQQSGRATPAPTFASCTLVQCVWKGKNLAPPRAAGGAFGGGD